MRSIDVREGFDVVVGGYAIVGDDDADPRAAEIVEVASGGLLCLEGAFPAGYRYWR